MGWEFFAGEERPLSATDRERIETDLASIDTFDERIVAADRNGR